MKKIYLAINLLALLLICGILVFCVEQNKAVTVTTGDEKAISKITEHTQAVAEELLTSLLFNGEALPFDREGGTFYLPLNMDKEAWEYGAITSGDEAVSILFLDSLKGVSKQEAIASNRQFRFIAFTGQKHRFYSLVFTGLPVMDIQIEQGELAAAARIDMRLYEADSKKDWVSGSAADIRVRGNTSRAYPKLGYKMELLRQNKAGETVSNALPLLGMRKDNDWILYAMYNDDTKVRDKLSIDLWNAFGADNNPFNASYGIKMEYVELIVDGVYHGLYGLMEPVDARKLDIVKSNGVNAQEYIYKRTTPAILALDDFLEESDAIVRCGFELKGLSKYGAVSLEDWQPLMDLIRVHTAEDDAYYIEEIPKVMDIESVTKTWLFLQIVSGLDNRAKNMYYVAKSVNGGMKIYFVPWDLDLTWGNVSKEAPPLHTAFEEEMLTEYVNWETADRVIELNVEDSITKVKTKWDMLRSSILTDQSLTKQIETLQSRVVGSGAMARDEARWPEGAHSYDFTQLYRYAVDKMQYLDTYMAELSQE